MLAKAMSGTVMSDSYRMLLLAYFHHSCSGHVINLGNIDVMGHITKIAAVENATAIWKDNWVLGGSLDVIAAICTLAIKVSVVLSVSMQALISYNIYA
jgi:hypothetical protein